jgi:phage gp29-like protein
MKEKKTTLIERVLTKFVGRFIPTAPRHRLSDREQPVSTISWIDADAMHGILQEAEDGYTERLFTLYRDIMSDAHTQGEINKRKLVVLKETPVFAPADPDNAAAVMAAEMCAAAWDGLKGKREALTHLLDSAAVYPVSIVRKQFRPGRSGSGLRYDLASLTAVPHHLIDYRDGVLKLRDVSADGRALSTYQAPSPMEYMQHRGHLLTSFPDKWGGPGRAIVFWWLFKTMDREWWGRFLDRFGAPFLVGKYEPDDHRARGELATAFAAATKIFGITIPAGSSVDMVQSAASSTGDAFEAFHRVANDELSKLIVGQTMTTTASAGGIGGTQAEVQAAVRDDIAAFDAQALATTLREDLFDQFLSINGIGAPRPLIRFGGQAPATMESTGGWLQALTAAGYEPGEDAEAYLGEVGGFAVRRKAGMPGLPIPLDAGADATLALAANEAAAFSRAMRGRHAAMARAIRESDGPGDLDRRLLAAIGGDGAAADLLADILAAGAANGARG